MIDYLSTEIIAYADFPLSFDDAYPISQLATVTVKYNSKTYYYDMSPT